MATGHLTPRKNLDGSTSYQLTVETDRDPLTGKRNRYYKTVKCGKRQADAELRKMIAKIEGGGISQPSAMKLADWLDTWLETYLPNIEETTRDGYREKIDNYIKPNLGHLPLKALSPKIIQDWINNLMKENLSPKTIRNAYNNLNAALKKAVILQMIVRNPCEGTELPKLQKYQAQVYSVAMIQQALVAADSVSLYLMILLGACVGLRRGEMAGLRWDHIDFTKETLTVVQNRVHAKKSVVEKAPKTQAGNRTIAIGKDVANALRVAKAAYDEAAKKPGFQALGYVLCRKDGKPFHPDSVTQKWERFVDKVQLPKIRLHDLRHSNATALIAAGVSAKIVQHRLGHSEISTTLNIYTHVLPEMDGDAAEKLNQSLFSTAAPIAHPPVTI